MSRRLHRRTGSRGEGSSWSPTRFANLRLWLRADKGITLNGGNVAAWADQSGSGDAGRHYAQANAAYQPIYVASDFECNGRPCVMTDASYLDHMISGTWNATYAQPLTVYWVGKMQYGGGRLMDGDYVANPTLRIIIWDDGSTRLSIYAGVTMTPTVSPIGVLEIGCAIFDTTPTSTMFVEDFTTAAAVSTGNAGTNGIGGIQYLFATNGPVGGGGGNKLAELIVYSGRHDEATRLRVQAYLQARYRSAWVPADIGATAFLYDAATGITLNGSDVSAWADQSGNARDLAMANALYQPLYSASDPHFRGHASIQGGTTDSLKSASAFSLPQPYSTFMVARPTIDGVYMLDMKVGPEIAQVASVAGFHAYAGSFTGYVGSNNTNVAAGYVVTEDSANTNTSVSASSYTRQTAGASNGTYAPGGLTLLNTTGSDGLAYGGVDVALVMGWDRALTADEDRKLQRWASIRFGLRMVD